MVDPLTLTIAVVTSVLAIFVIYYFYQSTAGFDKRWNVDKKKLLNHTEMPTSKVKSKSKEVQKNIKQKVRDLNLETFQTRLKAVVDLEPEYPAFLTAYLGTLTQKIDNLTDALNSAQTVKKALESKIENHKNGTRTAENKVAELKNVIAELNCKIQKLNSSQNEMAVTEVSVRNNNRMLTASLNKAKEDNVKLQGQISKIKEELSNANIKIKKMAFALETSKKETIKLCEEIQGLKMNIQEMETNAAGMKEKSEELVRKITHYESMAHDYERVIEQLRLNMQQMEINAFADKEALIREHTEEKRSWQEEEARINLEVNETCMLMMKIEREITRLENAYVSLELYKQHILSENEELHANQEELIAQNTKLTQTLDEKDNSNEVTHLIEVLANEKNQFHVEKEHVEQLEKNNSDLERIVEELEVKTKAGGKKQLIELREKNNVLMKKNQELTKKVAELKREVTRLEDIAKKQRQMQLSDMEGMYKKIEEAQRSSLEGCVMRCLADRESIDGVEASIKRVMATLANEETF